MSWLFSRALVEECLALISVASERFALLSTIGIADACLSNDKTSEPFQYSRYGMTFAPLKVNHGDLPYRLLLEDFRVNHLVRLHEDGERR